MMVFVGLIKRTDWDGILLVEPTTVVPLLPPVPKALTKRKLVLGVNNDVKPLADDGNVNKSGCPD